MINRKHLAFIKLVAGLTMDGECANCHSSEEENKKCNDHELFDIPNDDAVDTVHSLINQARALRLSDLERPNRIQRRRSAGWKMPANARYAGRPGPYGNPFKVGDKYRNGITGGEFVITQENCIPIFETYAKGRLAAEPDWFEPLRGFDLACWCSLDRPCHVDIILELLYA